MTDQNSILDYASPRKQGRFRLPAVSTLTCKVETDSVLVEQKLAAKAAAVMGLLFGGFTLFILLSSAATEAIVDDHFKLRSRPHWEFLLVPGAIAVLQISVAIAIVQQTWRRTRLWVEFNVLKLDMVSPLRTRRYTWAGDQIVDIIVSVTANEGTAVTLAEMLITRPTGGDARLFTDHKAELLRDITGHVVDVFRGGRTVVPGRS